MVKIEISLPIGYADDDVRCAVRSVLPVDKSEILEYRIIKRALSLIDGEAPKYKCTLALSFSPEREAGLLKMRNKVKPYEERIFTPTPSRMEKRPVVVGFGPAGIFAALILAEAGVRPIVIERGLDVDSRKSKVDLFNSCGVLDPECNVQFGEGGAGTFSDGKLKMGTRDEYKLKVIYEFVENGATEDIAFSQTAHLGTDKLPTILKGIRAKLLSLGAELIFGAKMTELGTKDCKVTYVDYEKDGNTERIETDAVILAIGHSARDTIKHLYLKGVMMTPRGFGIGMRIEHNRERINRLVYKDSAPLIDETASYHLVTHLRGGRSVYSFCMCPGGSVVAATSEKGAIVTNGMSEFARMADNSNSALLVSVTPSDFGSEHPLSGIAYQEKIEKAAYLLSNSYKAPSISLGRLLCRSSDNSSAVIPSYPLGTVDADPTDYLPDYITASLKEGILDFDAWMPGFLDTGAVLTGPETRSTSPVRMERGQDGEALCIKGLYPAGEGAGYAGGIISSAVDGIKEAEKLLLSYAKPLR
ncbi:MAG: hypothetical protein IKC32_05715 [Clostridia bacterium]|nr:hypothetical protein [Clostridia bacterium]